MHSVEQQSELIRLPEDPGVQSMLRAKLVEYEHRIEGAKRGSDQYADARYKSRLLIRLLEQGFVSIEEMREECEEDYGNAFKPEIFANAVEVVRRYCSSSPERRPVPQMIALTGSEEMRAFMRTKLQEYESRLDPDLPPEEQNSDATYKCLILSELLGAGQVDVRALYRSLMTKEGERFDRDAFINAALVIDYYNRNDMSNLEKVAS